MSKFFKAGMQARLTLWLILVLIPLALAGTIALNRISTSMADRIESDLMNTRRMEAARINEALDNYRHDLEMMSRSAIMLSMSLVTLQPAVPDAFSTVPASAPELASSPDLQALLDGLVDKAAAVGSEIVELQFTDTDGEVLVNSKGFEWQPYNRQLVARVIDEGRTGFGNAFRASDGEHRLGMVTPVFDGDNRVVGALMAETRLEPIVGLVTAHEGIGRTSEAHIAQPTPDGDAQFITLLRFKRDAAFNKIVPAEKHLPINQALHAPGGRLIRAADYRQIPSLLAVETLPATGWGLVVKIDTVEALEPVMEVRRIVLIAIAALFLILLAGWFLFLNPLGRRLHRLSEAAEQIAGGELNAVIADSSNDEIGDTARSIDRLTRALLEDMRLRAIAEEKLLHQAHHDELTGLLNRKRGNEIIAELDRERQSHPDRAILFLDLNGFKQINDHFGHDVGDQILVQVARRLQVTVDDQSPLIRWGGDEFVIVTIDRQACEVEKLVDRLRTMFSEPVVLPSGAHRVGCSIGVSLAGEQERLLHDVLVEADADMYERKKQEKSVVDADRRLRQAIDQGRVELAYRPVLLARPDADRQTVHSCEVKASIRMKSGPWIEQSDFLPHLSDSATHEALAALVLRRVITDLDRWRESPHLPTGFMLSLDSRLIPIDNPGIVTHIEELLAGAQLPGSAIAIDLTGDTTSINPDGIQALREACVRFGLSDFGAASSNLDRLVDLRPDYIKLDARWIDTTAVRHEPDMLFDLLQPLCASLAIPVIAGPLDETQLTTSTIPGISAYRSTHWYSASELQHRIDAAEVQRRAA